MIGRFCGCIPVSNKFAPDCLDYLNPTVDWAKDSLFLASNTATLNANLCLGRTTDFCGSSIFSNMGIF